MSTNNDSKNALSSGITTIFSSVQDLLIPTSVKCKPLENDFTG